jgi:hypothetical protein
MNISTSRWDKSQHYSAKPKKVEEKLALCRICSSHLQGWLVCVETLLDYGVCI